MEQQTGIEDSSKIQKRGWGHRPRVRCRMPNAECRILFSARQMAEGRSREKVAGGQSVVLVGPSKPGTRSYLALVDIIPRRMSESSPPTHPSNIISSSSIGSVQFSDAGPHHVGEASQSSR